jgi:hypothetical protein
LHLVGELLDRLELALADTPARTSVGRALSDLNRRLVQLAGKLLRGPVGLRLRGVDAKTPSKLYRCFDKSWDSRGRD